MIEHITDNEADLVNGGINPIFLPAGVVIALAKMAEKVADSQASEAE
jgi:hypothetical protein